jgi:hypothetical protein
MAVVSLHCRSFFALTLVDHFYEHLQKLRNAESGFSLVLCEIRHRAGSGQEQTYADTHVAPPLRDKGTQLAFDPRSGQRSRILGSTSYFLLAKR